MLRLEPFDPERELAAFRGRQERAGALVSFVGVARGAAKDGAGVLNLHLEYHPRLTILSLDQIAASAKARFAVDDVLVVHRCGDIAPGEPIVLAAAGAAHRRAAFEAVDYLMDRLKSEAMFWKREDRADGSEWIEPTDADARDLRRWS
jgi:molybdopterin synthase catalytic subunit